MIRHVRMVVLLARPAVILLLALYASAGLAQAGRLGPPLPAFLVLLMTTGFLLFSVVLNDLADAAIDRVNLPGDRSRPLVVGGAGRRELLVVAGTGAGVALAAGAALGWRAVAVTVAGMAVGAGYSLRPVRLADRGAVASMVLPACYVAVPYLLGLLAGGNRVTGGDLALLGALYLGFIGRIVLKDFRDVRGDALFGKRTFLVRHGRRWTCGFAACCWAAGTAAVLGTVRHPTPALAGALLTCLVIALGMLRALAVEDGARRDEFLISAIAIVGRGMVLTLVAHLAMIHAGWDTVRYAAVVVGLTIITAGQASAMRRYGPVVRAGAPDLAGLPAPPRRVPAP